MKLAAATLFVLIGTSGPGRLEAQDPTIPVSSTDAGMAAAEAEAQRTLPELIARLAAPPPGQTNAGVKFRLPDSHPVELVWLYDVAYVNGRFTGKVGNDVSFGKLKAHDTTSVSRDSVSDWMAIDGGRLVGGYSIRLLRSRMNAEERAQFEKEAPFKFTD